jgi:hypothetical protein
MTGVFGPSSLGLYPMGAPKANFLVIDKSKSTCSMAAKKINVFGVCDI